MQGFTLFDPGAPTAWAEKSDGQGVAKRDAHVADQSVASVASVAQPSDKRLGNPTLSPADAVRSAVRDLAYIPRPANVSFSDWATLISDLQDFTETALPFALAKGWQLFDLFAVPANPTHRRVDQVGLVPMLRGRPVRIIDSNRAAIANRVGPPNTFYRRAPGCSQPFDRSGGALIWDIYLKETAS